MCVIVPSHSTDCLQLLDISVNQAAMQFCTKLENWHADQIVVQNDVEKKLNQWTCGYVHCQTHFCKVDGGSMFLHPQIIKNGFKHVWMTDFLAK